MNNYKFHNVSFKKINKRHAKEEHEKCTCSIHKEDIFFMIFVIMSVAIALN